MCRVHRDPQSGTVLMEVLLAVAILAVGLTAIIHAMMSHAQACRVSAEYTAAAYALDQFIAPALLTISVNAFDEIPVLCTAPSGEYECSIHSAKMLSSPDPRVVLESVKAEARWRSGKSERHVTVSIYRPKVLEL